MSDEQLGARKHLFRERYRKLPHAQGIRPVAWSAGWLEHRNIGTSLHHAAPHWLATSPILTLASPTYSIFRTIESRNFINALLQESLSLQRHPKPNPQHQIFLGITM